MLNILHTESGLNWGGQEYRTLKEVRWLRARGHGAWLACNPNSEVFRRGGDLCLALPMRGSFDPSALRQLRSLLRRHSIDIVHAHSPRDAWICYPLHLAGVPVVRSRQITNTVSPKWSRSFSYRRGCARIIATSECIRRQLVEKTRIPAERITVIGEGVDLEEFNPHNDGRAFRAEFGVTESAPLFGIVAMLRPEKGHDVFLKAAELVLKFRPHARFAIVGEGIRSRKAEYDCRKHLARLFGNCRTGSIFMTGYRSDTPAVMAALDVLVVPSLAEAQSLVVPQAFATRRAVIASRVGGLPELVEHEHTGLLVPPGSAPALADAMLRLIDDPALRDRLAQAGHACAQAKLSFDLKMEQTIKIYRGMRDSNRLAPAKKFPALQVLSIETRVKTSAPDNVVPFPASSSTPVIYQTMRIAAIIMILSTLMFGYQALRNAILNATDAGSAASDARTAVLALMDGVDDDNATPAYVTSQLDDDVPV